MKKFTAALFGILLCALISMIAINPAQAFINRFTWLPPYIDKDSGVVIYGHGSTVQLLVPVENDWYPAGLNVSRVIVSFDWGQNKTLDLSANIEHVEEGETKIFTVSFTADANEAVSSDWAHEYTIHVEHVNATSGPTKIVGTWSVDWNDFWPSYRFVVFSTDQADALDLSIEYYSYESTYPVGDFLSTNASQLAGQAKIEAILGSTHYMRGDYASAKTQYETALGLYSQALSVEAEWGTKLDEAALEVTLTEAEANMAMANAELRQADAVVNQSYAYILFGLGFVFIGVATIIYASRKPKAG